MKKVVVDRSRWRYGGGHLLKSFNNLTTRLLDEKGKMCCLGFTCQQVMDDGPPLLGACTPEALGEVIEGLTGQGINNGDVYIAAVTSSLDAEWRML